MKKSWIILVIIAFVVKSVDVNAEEAYKKVLGTWKFDVKEAPYEFQIGKAFFYQEDKITKVKLAFDYEDINGSKLIIEGNKVTFEAVVQYETVFITLELIDEKLIGEASTSEGDIAVTMKRVKK